MPGLLTSSGSSLGEHRHRVFVFGKLWVSQQQSKINVKFRFRSKSLGGDGDLSKYFVVNIVPLLKETNDTKVELKSAIRSRRHDQKMLFWQIKLLAAKFYLKLRVINSVNVAEKWQINWITFSSPSVSFQIRYYKKTLYNSLMDSTHSTYVFVGFLDFRATQAAANERSRQRINHSCDHANFHLKPSSNCENGRLMDEMRLERRRRSSILISLAAF